MATVKPFDRNAAERFNVELRADLTGTQLNNLAGVLAAHREAAVAEIVAWLRKQSSTDAFFADAIERGACDNTN